MVPDADFHMFVDGGSGLALRGTQLGESPDKKRFHFLITHTHWDHILGLPFFDPIYNEENELFFYSSQTERSCFTDLFFGLQRSGNLPVPRNRIKAKIHFETILPAHPFMIEDKIQIDSFQLNHQGVTLGYKISTSESSVAIITDNAPIESNHMGEGMKDKAKINKKKFENDFNKGLIDFLSGVHTVVFDTHFTEQNLKADWGHSTPPRALEFCKAAGTKRLVLFHHAPEDTDQDVDAKVQSIFHDACRANIEVEAAREGDLWDLCA